MYLDDLVSPGFANLELWEETYSKYLADPNSVDESWRDLFSQLESGESIEFVPLAPPSSPDMEKSVVSIAELEALNNFRIFFLIQAYRTYGHLMAHTDPLASHSPDEPYRLQLRNLGFRPQEIHNEFPTRGLLDKEKATLKEIIERLRSIYCGKIGYEYMGFQSPEIERWVQQKIENPQGRTPLSIEQKQMILQQLNKSELLESFLHTKYVGQKRFSIEGGETFVPMISSAIETGASLGVQEFILGMAHRGRLNVMSNILNKSYEEVFKEFDENYVPEEKEGAGDVKYHKGFSSEIRTSQNQVVFVSLPSNPSHLESVNPVLEGQARAKLTEKGDLDRKGKVLPILVHGDAAIAGQGVVYETMELSRLKGYSTGGTLHLVINNHIGFTTLPGDFCSTRYCTDIAKTFEAPVFHVNAEDPEGCVFVTNLAVELRQKFHCDVFIDLNCYRKYGHNEGDEPAFTQPLAYQKIKQKRPVREIYRDALIQEGVMEKFMAEEMESEFKKALQMALKDMTRKVEEKVKTSSDEEKKQEKSLFTPVETGVSLSLLQTLAQKICSVPQNIHVHSKLEHLLKERLNMVQEGEEAKPVDWGMAELLAYSSLLVEQIPIRFTGQDCSRGTFSHRHALWVDQKTEEKYFPLAHLSKDQAQFDLYNSPLSELAALGFEFGYSMALPDSLVIWEAQFGDFVNGAQVVIDQYISTSEQKWGRNCSLVLLLPHGYEGQGPEHSSARIERFLTLAGNDNMFIVNPTLPHQLFHLIRRQVKGVVRKPLVVLTPKGLLRHPDCTSGIAEFTHGSFQEILDDPQASKEVNRLAFCSGRIYFDLLAERNKRGREDIAMIRVEQLYPFHKEKAQEILNKYSQVKEYLWVQEEPYNMGAWHYIHPIFQQILPKEIQYVGRPRSASPATGFHHVHKQELMHILKSVFPETEPPTLGAEYLQRV